MQIREIINEGFWSGLTGLDFKPTQASINRQAEKSAQQLKAQGYGKTATSPATYKTVVEIPNVNQNTVSKYYKTGNIWTNELGSVILDPKQKKYLDSLIPTLGKKIAITVPPPAATGRRPRKTFVSKKFAQTREST